MTFDFEEKLTEALMYNASGSVSGNFPIESFDTDDISINIFGLIYFENYFEHGCHVDCETMHNNIESTVNKFIKYLKMKNDYAFERIDFFGDVQIKNEQIVSFPTYFIQVYKKCQLFRIHGTNLTEIEIECIDENEDYDELISSLERIDPNILNYYFDTNDEYTDDDEHVIRGIFQDDISGNYMGSIIGIMNGDILGTLKGNICGMMNGNIHQDLYGNISGVLNGDIYGDVYGNITGTVNGEIRGNVYGVVTGQIEGTIYGEIFQGR